MAALWMVFYNYDWNNDLLINIIIQEILVMFWNIATLWLLKIHHI